MKLYQFNDLDEFSKLDVVWRNGSLLLEQIEGNFLYALYQLDYFYVEVKFNSLCNTFYGIRAYTSNSCYIEKYLDAVDLSSLLKIAL